MVSGSAPMRQRCRAAHAVAIANVTLVTYSRQEPR
jgi:hypothetical protein